jgi:hypothetical protein
MIEGSISFCQVYSTGAECRVEVETETRGIRGKEKRARQTVYNGTVARQLAASEQLFVLFCFYMFAFVQACAVKR